MSGRSVTYEYTNNNLTAVRDVRGNRWLYAYDASRRLTKVFQPQAPTQAVVTNVYDTFGRVQTQADVYNNTTTFHWGGPCNAETNPDGSRVSHCFDAFGRHISTIDAAGKRTYTTYDSQWRLHTFTDALGDVMSISYHAPSGLLASTVDAAGYRTTFSYTVATQSLAGLAEATSAVTLTFYNLTRLTYPDGNAEQFAYDSRGNLLRLTDPSGAVWQYTYNSLGQPLTMVNPGGGTATLTYHPDGTLASSRDSDTGVSSYAYDAYKRLTRIVRPDGTEMAFAYDLADNILRATDERGETATFVYDANGNMASAIAPPAEAVTATYDLLDRMTRRTDALGKASTYTYDNMDRLKTVIDRNGNAMTLTYDTRG